MPCPKIAATVFAATLLLLGNGASAQQPSNSSGNTAASSGAQSEKPDATIEFSGGSVALGIGYSWGHGVLHFQGKDYPFTANGFSVVNVGASSVEATGNVYNLKKVEDFPGNYMAAAAGATVAGGAAGAAMENQHGVVIRATSKNQGLQLTLAPSGIAIALEGPPAAMSGSSSQ